MKKTLLLTLALAVVFFLDILPSSAFAQGWERIYGGRVYDYAYSIQRISYGGHIVASKTGSFDASNYAWVIKLDAKGNVQWRKTYGRKSYDNYAYSIQQTSDGGYIVAGYTESFNIRNARVIKDALVIKLDAKGNVQWQKTYGGEDDDYAYSIQQTSDGGYIVAGYSWEIVVLGEDALVLKLDAKGN
jgi:hypothetical protein